MNLRSLLTAALLVFLSFGSFSSSSGREEWDWPRLPRWRTFEETLPKRGRALPEDYRRDNIELYRITEPPFLDVRSPGEFEEVSGVILTWVPGFYDETFVGFCQALNGYVTIYILYARESHRNRIIDALMEGGISQEEINDPLRFVFIKEDIDSVWVRDSGPNFILTDDGKVGVVDARYYFDRFYDDKIPTEISQYLGITPYRPSFDMEGGIFMTDGTGRCFTTKGNIWENLPESEEYVSGIYRDYFGCTDVTYLMPLSGEGTTHIDMFAKFLDTRNIIIGEYSEESDCINYDILDYVAEVMMDLTNNHGEPYEVTRIPMPSHDDGVWRSYANSLIVNRKVLVPVFNDDTELEEEALEVYQDLLPDHEVVPIDSTEIIMDGGAVHCIAMTVPAGNLEAMEDPIPLCGDTWDCDPTEGCGGETFEGRCDDNTSIWCEGGDVYWYPCDTDCAWVFPGDPCENTCGYDSSNGYYFCLDEDICESCIDHCEGDEAGCTADTESAWDCLDEDSDECMERAYEDCGMGECIDGDCRCVGDCTGRECGDDGCGGSCGECAEGFYCDEEGHCIEDGGTTGPEDDGGDGEGCGGCSIPGRGGRTGPSPLLSIIAIAALLLLTIRPRRISINA